MHAFRSSEEEEKGSRGIYATARHGYAQSLFNDTTGVSGLLFIRSLESLATIRGQGFVQECYDDIDVEGVVKR